LGAIATQRELGRILTGYSVVVVVEFRVHAGGDSRSGVLAMETLEEETPRGTPANVRMAAAHLCEERAHAIGGIDDFVRRVKFDVRAQSGH
jgi:hypothetical protein